MYGYDAEQDADLAIEAYLKQHEPYDPKTGVTDRELERFVGWLGPKYQVPLKASKL